MNKTYDDWRNQIYYEAVYVIEGQTGLDAAESLFEYFNKNYEVASLRDIFDWELQHWSIPVSEEQDNQFAIYFADRMSRFIATNEFFEELKRKMEEEKNG